MKRQWWPWLILWAALGCSRGESSSSAPSSVAPTSVASPSPVAASPSPAVTSTAPADTTTYMATMFTKLAEEREGRPTGTPRVEVVLAALMSGGVALQPGRQVLAAIVKARYCWQASTADGALGVAICEYDSPEAAKAGRDAAASAGAAFGDRTILVNGKTTLLLKGPAAEVERASRLFEKLAP